MQDLYYEQTREKLLIEIAKNEENFFIAFIKHVDIEYLKTIPFFKDLAQKVLPKISGERLHMAALYCVHQNNLGAIRYLVEECGKSMLVHAKLVQITLFFQACVDGHEAMVEYLLNCKKILILILWQKTLLLHYIF